MIESKKIMIDGVETDFVTSLDNCEIERNNYDDLDRPTIDLNEVINELKKITESGNSNG